MQSRCSYARLPLQGHQCLWARGQASTATHPLGPQELRGWCSLIAGKLSAMSFRQKPVWKLEGNGRAESTGRQFRNQGLALRHKLAPQSQELE